MEIQLHGSVTFVLAGPARVVVALATNDVGVGRGRGITHQVPSPGEGWPAASVISVLRFVWRERCIGVRDSRLTARSSIGPRKRGLFKIYALPPAFKYLTCQLIWYFERPQFLLVLALSSSQNTCLFTTQWTSGIPLIVLDSMRVKCQSLFKFFMSFHSFDSLF